MRPNFIKEEDINRWKENIANDPFLENVKRSKDLEEVCFATYWLWERLIEEDCPEEIALRIQYTAGSLSFGRDPWEVCQNILEQYDTNQLEFEDEKNAVYN